jgi:5-bromo-4-chloroindolyl phosphate hydrolysis protein
MPTPYRQQVRNTGTGIGPFALFLVPLPLIIVIVSALMQGAFFRILSASCALGLAWTAGWFLRKARIYEIEANRRKWTRATRVPWRFSAAIFAGGSAFLVTTLLMEHNIFVGALAALGGFAGVIMAYGFDPQYDRKKDVSRFGVTTEEIVEALDEAEQNLAQIQTAAGEIGNTELRSRLGRIVDKTRGILRQIEEDPKDLRRARKFLKVYLSGARDVTRQYASTHSRQQNDELEGNFRNVLMSIEDVIEEQHQKLLDNDVLDLDVKIEVLETQLKHEGII